MTDIDRDRLAAAAAAIDAPDVVIACSQHGERMVATGGTAAGRDPATVAAARYEIGSASKTFTGLLLAQLSRRHVVKLSDPVTWYLPPRRAHARRDAIALFHLVTHTSGLPRLPPDLFRRGLPHWFTNPYAGYTTEQLVDAFTSTRPVGRPGTRWRYSNFGVAMLGTALTEATGTPFEPLLTEEILSPLGLKDTALTPQPGDATGHGYRGRRPTPAFDAGIFAAAGAVRATADDLLTYLETHLDPDRVPALSEALRFVQRTAVRRGLRKQHHHSLCWFVHEYDDGPVFFHAGATPGQEAFVGFRPATGTAVVVLGTRRYRYGSSLQQQAYALLI
ncbi:serine hydrolase domain-containing protein [Actinophytocola glycyrrhizae]|uniref:Serine hydrolase domain-containing protein n=1 Tax=Actinophytocola glycyrrhizae TaxID=2044873 RepID=A0ABV9RVM5_9PSEU